MAKKAYSIRGFNDSLNQIDNAFIQRIDKIEKEFRKSMSKIAQNAKRDAPIDVLGPHPGQLADSISWDEPGKLSYELRADVPYAAFVEFGTGKYARKQLSSREGGQYWRDIAKPFQGDKDGNMPAQPFFYNNIRKELPRLRERIAKILSKNA
jgi:hypothetical protein